VRIGQNNSQHDIFEYISRQCNYDPDTRFVILTLNMDHMGAGASEMVFNGQVLDIARLRAKYPTQVLPFLSIDPRAGVDAIKKLIVENIGLKKVLDADGREFELSAAYIGLKFYPALGYFPFDVRLEAAFDLAYKHGLPIMTHCTRNGSFYLGDMNAQMATPIAFEAMDFSGVSQTPDYKQPNGEFAVDYKASKLEASSVFGKPRAWRFVLDHKPEWKNLKVCFAHMGGGYEVFFQKPRLNDPNWFKQILGMMGHYPNTYTDISYTLSWEFPDKKNAFYLKLMDLMTGKFSNSYQNDVATNPWTGKDENISEMIARGGGATFYASIPQRILFGTDFFVAEQEGHESDFSQHIGNWLVKQPSVKLPNGTELPSGAQLWKMLSEDNPKAYLASKVYTP
jgi:predicted TIM-barrel fold metal-dependent hydrolase